MIYTTNVWVMDYLINKEERPVVKDTVKFLKPCPFCGGRADLRYSINKALVECTNKKCKLRPSTWLYVDTDSVDKLVNIWNERKYEED